MVCSLGSEPLVDTAGIYIGAVVDHCDLISKLVLSNVGCGCSTLIRVREAYAEYVRVLCTLNGRTGRCDLEHIVSHCLVSDCYARSGCYSTHDHLHAPVF